MAHEPNLTPLAQMPLRDVLRELIGAVDRFDDTINFYMDDAAWDALESLRGIRDAAEDALAREGTVSC